MNLKIKDQAGSVLAEKSIDVKDIEENSALKLADVSEAVLGTVQGQFYVELSLSDKQGTELSANEYMLLIGDQEAASARMKEMGAEERKINGKYTYGNYYRFFPALNGEREINWESETEVPKAEGF